MCHQNKKQKHVDCSGRWPTPAGKATVENPFHKFEKTYEMTWDVARGKRVICSDSQRVCTAHFHIISCHFLQVMTDYFYPPTLFDKEPLYIIGCFIKLFKIPPYNEW